MIQRTDIEQAQYEAEREEMYQQSKRKAAKWYKEKAPKVFKTLGKNKTRWPDWYFNRNYKLLPGIEPNRNELKDPGNELF